jgi:predicted O-methyltransferase YrrM
MIEEQGWARRWVMAQMFARHYAERLTGHGYPMAADQIAALLTTHEKQTLYRLAGLTPKRGCIVEIGSFKGASAYLLAAGSARQNTAIHCIDTFMAENVEESLGADTHAEFSRNVALFQERIVVHRGWSTQVAGEIAEHIDLLFVDGDHSYEGVSADLLHYLPKLATQGIVIMHDSAHPPVAQAIREQLLPRETERLARLPNMYAGRISLR